MASNIRTPVAAAAAGISKARLSQIENGYEKRGSEYRPVTGSDAVIAHLGAVTGVTPRQLDEAGRPVAASVLRIILERQQAQPDDPEGATVTDLLPPVVRDNWGNPYVRRFWESTRDADINQDLRLILAADLAQVGARGDDGSGSGASAAGQP